MKKIILLVSLLSLLNTVKVQAKVYYSDYSEYKQTMEKMEETDLLKVKTETKYLLFKEKRIEKLYPDYMEIKDMIKTDEKELVTSDWLDEKPEELPNRKIIEQKLYEYQNMKKIRYIKINKFKNIKSTFDVAEIQIYSKDNQIDYDIISNISNISILKDNNLEKFISFSKNDEILIDLNDGVDIYDLKIMFNLHTDSNTDVEISIELLGEEENVYAKTTLVSSLKITDTNYCSILLNKDHFRIYNPVYEEPVLSQDKVLAIKFRLVKEVTKYKTEDLYTKYYYINREYLDDYYVEAFDDYQLDFDTKKEFYYAKTRDMVEIKDILFIDNYDTKLEEFIINKSIDDIKITSDINYYRNGKYTVNFILPFKTIEKEVIVNINENYLNALKKQNEYLTELEQNNKKLFMINSKLNTELKEVLEDKDEQINSIRNEVIKYKYENDNLKIKKQDLEETKNDNNYQKPLVLASIFLLAFITFFLRNKSA